MSFPFDLLAFDLDDTLLRPTHDLAPRTRDALVACHEAGARVMLASGRMLSNMRPVAQALPFPVSVVSYNGALVHADLGQEPVYHRPVPAALASEVIDWAFARDLHLHFYVGNSLFTNRIDDWKARVYREHTGAVLEFEPDFERFRGQAPTKMLIADEPERIAELLEEGRERFGERLKLTRSRPIYLEFLHPEVDKGRGFEALCKYLQVPLERTAAFGDAYNDTEMLALAGQAVVMENSLPEVKEMALKQFNARICPSNQDDGVAQVLEEWLRAGSNLPAPGASSVTAG
jgi:Cof subfamily protein (haloacid dehalogenase superfamily)